MITRRGFFGAVAALAVSPVAAKAASLATAAPIPVHALTPSLAEAEWIATLAQIKRDINHAMYADGPDRFCRRDDGDTILELR